jgi:hypothetical protein
MISAEGILANSRINSRCNSNRYAVAVFRRSAGADGEEPAEVWAGKATFGPDGTRWDNRMVFTRIDAPRLIEADTARTRTMAPRASTSPSRSTNRATANGADYAPAAADQKITRRRDRLRRGGAGLSGAGQTGAVCGRELI